MAVYAPGDSSPDPSQGIDPGMWARLMNYLNPVSPAAADTLTQGPNPLANPSPVDPRLAGGGPPVPPGLLGGGQAPAPMPPGAPLPPVPGGPGGSSGGAGASTVVGPSILPQARGSLPPPDMTRHMPWPPGYGPETTHMPYPNQLDPKGVFAPKPAAQPVVARGGAKRAPVRIPGSATALAPAAGGKSPFINVDAQNQDWSGGALSRLGTRQMTALDLSKLFSRS